MNIHRARAAEVVVAPHDVQQCVARKDVPGAGGKDTQQFIFLEREGDLPDTYPHLVPREVDAEIADVYLVLVGGTRAESTVQQGKAGDDLRRISGYENEIIEAERGVDFPKLAGADKAKHGNVDVFVAGGGDLAHVGCPGERAGHVDNQDVVGALFKLIDVISLAQRSPSNHLTVESGRQVRKCQRLLRGQ